MKYFIAIVVISVVSFWDIAGAQDRYSQRRQFDYMGQQEQESHFNRHYPRKIYTQPYEQNAYGLGVHKDATGQAFQWRDKRGRVDDIGGVQRDTFGQHRNMFGEEVEPSRYGDD